MQKFADVAVSVPQFEQNIMLVIECRHAGFAPRPNILCENLGFQASVLQGYVCREVFAFAVRYLLLPCSICFCREFLLLPWSIWFCREVFAFAVKYLVLPWGILPWGILFLPWAFWFCRVLFCFCCEVFGFAVRFLFLPWRFWFCRDSCGPPYVPATIASIMSKSEQILWERFRNILEGSFKHHENSE